MDLTNIVYQGSFQHVDRAKVLLEKLPQEVLDPSYVICVKLDGLDAIHLRPPKNAIFSEVYPKKEAEQTCISFKYQTVSFKLGGTHYYIHRSAEEPPSSS